MTGLLIGLAIRWQAVGAAAVPPPSAPSLLGEAGDHLLLEGGDRLLLE